MREPTAAFRPAIDTPRSARGFPSGYRSTFAYLVINEALLRAARALLAAPASSPPLSFPCSAQTSTALAAGMIIRARTPSLIMQGAVRWPSRPSGGLCGCWWPLESSGAETSLLHDHAERHVLWRLSRGSHAAVHALMQRSSSRASSERDDSSSCPQGTRPRMLALSQTALRPLNRALRALKGCCRKELSL